MARIPLGNFGNAIAQPKPRVQQIPGAFDNGGAALAELGSTAMQAASAEIERQRQENERLAREKKQEEAALARARGANAVLERQDQLGVLRDDITQRLKSGQLRYDEAIKTYDEAVGMLETPDVGQLDPITKANLDNGYKRIGITTRAAILRASSEAMTGEFKSRADAALDLLGKQASLPGSDPSALAAQADTIDEIGVRAYGSGWAKKKQDWMDGNWDAHLNQRAMSVRDSIDGIKELEKDVTSGQYADKLDSNRRNTLVMKLEGYRTSLLQRHEMAAQRAERERERYMRQAEAEFNTFQALADKGTIIAPEYVDRVAKMTSGTPYQAGVRAISQQARETGGIAAQPVAVQQATLDALDRQIAQHGRTPELDRRREQVAKVLNASRADIKENGLRAGLERGVITELAPIDTSTPQALSATIGRRLDQAETVSVWSGKPVSPLDAQEAAQLRATLQALPPGLKSQAVASLAASVGPRASGAIARQLDGQDRALALAFATSGAKTTQGRYASELIMKGAGALKDGAVMKDDKKVTGWKATISNMVDGAFHDEIQATAVKDAAYLIAAGIAQENGGTASGSDIERAVRIAVGGNIIEHNGKRIPVAGNLDDGEFRDKLKMINPRDIMKQLGSTGSRKAKGMIEPGNIDLSNRPTVHNSDGSISTVRSMNVGINGKEVLIPTVVGNKILSDQDAIDHYLKTGEHLGIFDSTANAVAYAKDLHKKQESSYMVRAGGVEIPVSDFVRILPGQELVPAGLGRYAVIVRGRPVVNANGRPVIIEVK